MQLARSTSASSAWAGTTSGSRATPRSCGTASRRWSAYADNAPIIVERAEGHELIDVDGRRYLDAISSLWVTTLGHRVPELDDALREQLDRGAHSTMLGNGNRVVVELAEALAARRARRRAALPVRVRRRRRGRAGAEDRVPVLGQPRRRRPHARTSRSAARTTATPSARSRSATAGSAPTCSTRCASRCCARPRFADPDCFDTACAMVAEHASELAAVVVEPLVQGAAGMQLADPDGLARARRRVPRARRAADLRRGRDRLRPHRHAVRVGAVRAAARPAVPRQGPHRRLPADVGDGRERPRVRRVPRPRPVASARCTTGTRTAGTRSRAAVALRHLELLDEWDVLANVRARSDELRGLLDDRVAPHPGGARGAPRGPDGRRRARAARRRPAVGPAGVRGRGRAGRAAAPARRRRRAHAAAHDHLAGAPPHRRTRSPTRSTR